MELNLALYYYYTHNEDIDNPTKLWQDIIRADIVSEGNQVFVTFLEDIMHRFTIITHRFTILDNGEMQFEGEVEYFDDIRTPDNYEEYINNEVKILNYG